MNSYPTVVTPEVLTRFNGNIKAADSKTSVNRFVYSFPSTETTKAKPEKVFAVDENTWNDQNMEAAYKSATCSEGLS